MPNLGSTVTYTAGFAPSGASLPVSYSWSLSPASAGTINGSSTESTVSVTWDTLGTHTINLSTTNCGATVTSSSSIIVSNVYNKCDNVIAWNTPGIVCNGDNTTTMTVSVNGNNSEDVEFSVDNQVSWSPATSNGNTFEFNYPSNGNSVDFHARIVGCTTVIYGAVQACTTGYNKCLLNIYFNTPTVTCNTNNTTTVDVSVDGDNGEAIEFSINGGTYVAATSGNSSYSFNVPSNGAVVYVDARVVGCTNTINGNVTVCTTTPPPPCVPITTATIAGDSSAIIPANYNKTYSVTYDGDSPHTFVWTAITPNNSTISYGTGNTSSVIFNECGTWTVRCVVTNCSGNSVTVNYEVVVTKGSTSVPTLSGHCFDGTNTYVSVSGGYPVGKYLLFEADTLSDAINNSGVYKSTVDNLYTNSIQFNYPLVLNKHYYALYELCGDLSVGGNIISYDYNVPC